MDLESPNYITSDNALNPEKGIVRISTVWSNGDRQQLAIDARALQSRVAKRDGTTVAGTLHLNPGGGHVSIGNQFARTSVSGQLDTYGKIYSHAGFEASDGLRVRAGWRYDYNTTMLHDDASIDACACDTYPEECASPTFNTTVDTGKLCKDRRSPTLMLVYKRADWRPLEALNISDSGAVSIFGERSQRTVAVRYVAATDGFVLYRSTVCRAEALIEAAGNREVDKINGYAFQAPVRKGETWRINFSGTPAASGCQETVTWIPFGLDPR